MLVSDLEHLSDLEYSVLAETSNLLGGAGDNVIFLSLSKGVLSLKLNDRDIFSTPYVGVPSSLMISLEGVSNLRSAYRLENINGVVKSSWTLSTGTLSSVSNPLAPGLFGFLSEGLLS
jgi:hypothetical protein